MKKLKKSFIPIFLIVMAMVNCYADVVGPGESHGGGLREAPLNPFVAFFGLVKWTLILILFISLIYNIILLIKLKNEEDKEEKIKKSKKKLIVFCIVSFIFWLFYKCLDFEGLV